MKTIVLIAFLIVIMLAIIALPLLADNVGVVMSASDTTPIRGSLRIPTAGVNASLSLAHVDCDCCYMGLRNGGIIICDAQIVKSVKVGDWADIRTSDSHLVLECVEIKHTLGAFVKPEGDVLICVRCWPLMKVYRFIVL